MSLANVHREWDPLEADSHRDCRWHARTDHLPVATGAVLLILFLLALRGLVAKGRGDADVQVPDRSAAPSGALAHDHLT